VFCNIVCHDANTVTTHGYSPPGTSSQLIHFNLKRCDNSDDAESDVARIGKAAEKCRKSLRVLPLIAIDLDISALKWHLQAVFLS